MNIHSFGALLILFVSSVIYPIDLQNGHQMKLPQVLAAAQPSLEVQQMYAAPLEQKIFENLEVAIKERLQICKNICKSRQVNARSSLEYVAIDKRGQNFSAYEAAEAAYVIGVRYLLGTQPVKNADVRQGEQWLLQARKYGYLPAHDTLIRIALVSERYKDVLRYSFDAINDGKIDKNYFVARAYQKLDNASLAEEYFKKTITVLEPYRAFPSCKILIDDSQLDLACLWLNGNNKSTHPQAITILKSLSSQGIPCAQAFLGKEYIRGVTVQRDTAEGLRLLFDVEQKIKQEANPILYWRTVSMIAHTYEGLFGKDIVDIQKALEYYQKNQLLGSFHRARLVLTNKIPGDKQAAEQDLKKGADGGAPMALFLIGSKLFLESPEDGISYLQKASGGKNETPLIWLQLAIAHKYGIGVKANNKTVDCYLSKIKNNSETHYKSLLLARGYMRLMGLGVGKDTKEGLRLIDESETKIDDVYFKTEDLLPFLDSLKKKHESWSAASAAAASIVQAPEGKDETPLSLSKEQWNDHFTTDDGSIVKRIDLSSKQIELFDRERNEKLVVHLPTAIERDLACISALTFHSRIFKRQQVKRENTKHNHTFAQMLDYVIQYCGQLVPFVKDGISQSQDCLIADVTRIDLSTGKKVECRAEYTFIADKKSDDACVYHRLLRPKKK